MSARNAIVLLLSLSTLLFLAACGSSGPTVTKGQAPPSGAFSDGNLNGTYVFSVSGEDLSTGGPYTVVGAINANGGGAITGGTIDMNDPAVLTSAVVAAPISSGGSYTIGPDGRGVITINFTGDPYSSLSFDLVLQNSFHGLVIERDANATGSGTIDSQTAGTTPSGSYAFSFSGETFSNGEPFATVGNFTLTGSTAAGLEDFNAAGTPYTNTNAGLTLTGSVSAGPSNPPTTSLTATETGGTAPFGPLTFDVYPIDSTHLKFIEVDSVANLSGDAFSNTTPTIPTGNLAFTLGGILTSEAPFAAGGIMVTNGSGGIISGSIEDYDSGGTTSSAPVPFTGTYTGSAGRFSLGPLSGFSPATVTGFVAYPSSGGVLLLETDGTGGINSGAAYAQTAGATFAASQGYGLNLSGENFSSSTPAEVDDIAEFTAAATGTSCTTSTGTISSDTLTGVTDENSSAGTTYGAQLCGQYSGPDSTGRLGISYAAGTINGGVTAIAYTVDGTTFPFIETDQDQVSTGVFVLQNAAATSPSVAKAHSMFVPQTIRPHAANQKKQMQK